MSVPKCSHSASFLGIDRSVTDHLWHSRHFDNHTAQEISRRYNLPDLLGRILAARRIPIDSIADFLAPTLRSSMPDPICLKDMDQAAERLVTAIINGESIGICADYDVDGLSSAALCYRFLQFVDRAPYIYIPDRLTEGYGPTSKTIHTLKEKGVSLAIMVDCGTVAFEVLKDAYDSGLDVIVLDHHRVEDRLPHAFAIVNPQRHDDRSELTMLCGVGIVMMTITAVNRILRQNGWYQEKKEPPLIHWLDLVVLGTICDIMPLIEINRAFVTQGLKIMAQWRNIGLATLAKRAHITSPPTPYHVGFILGPRLNAAGRVGHAYNALQLLISDDPTQTTYLTETLEINNTKRKKIEAAVLTDILTRLDEHEMTGPLIISGQKWHPGVIGIVAARVLERVRRPVCVISIDNDIGRGAGRSIKGFDLGTHILAARQAGILLNGGGHEMAAGFTIHTDRLEEFHSFMHARYQDTEHQNHDMNRILDFDGLLSTTAATPRLVSMLDTLAPFGPKNPAVRFAITDVFISYTKVISNSHVRVIASGSDGSRLKAIAFRARGTPLGHALLTAQGRGMHLSGTLRTTMLQGKEDVELVIDDAAYTC